MLLVFLRDWRLTLVASVTLPLTVMTTFLVMRWLGETINLMSMGGLAVAIGLVIDDAVVVVENIHRHLDSGETPAQSVQLAMRELIAPVVGSTLTTVVVFVPLGLLSGVVGQFFRALSLTLSAAVLISLVLALTLDSAAGAVRGAAPARRRPAARRTSTRRPPRARVFAHARLDHAPAGHRDRRRAAARGRRAVLLFSALGTGFLPEADEGGFVIDYLTPPGTALEETDRVAARRSKPSCRRRRRSRRSRAAPDRSSACSRRSRTRATSSCGSKPPAAGGARPTRSSATCATS